MTSHRYASCTECRRPLIEVKLYSDVAFLITGARCLRCGNEYVYQSNDFDYSKHNPVSANTGDEVEKTA